ncbi:O-antigen ligase family protein [Shewanella rhizosphaerae]|uniref:O-antigen ligase family protein n=1 Tax=Shewanella rhizosphaerae TaxID=2864207 RepID=UPI001C65F8F2|nr:O-antigen ligase family protein [Shewanella rhizosphaerae]QYK14260.1 O-antigen ligase family protein [Shewanella rhizosphaerae]
MTIRFNYILFGTALLVFLLLLPGTFESVFFFNISGFYISIIELIIFGCFLRYACLRCELKKLNFILILIVVCSLVASFLFLNFSRYDYVLLDVIFSNLTFIAFLFCFTFTVPAKIEAVFIVKALKVVVYGNFIYLLLTAILIPNFLSVFFPELLSLRSGYSLDYLSSGIIYRVQSLIGSANTTGTLVCLISVGILIHEIKLKKIDVTFHLISFVLVCLTLSRTGMILFFLAYFVAQPKLILNSIFTRKGLVGLIFGLIMLFSMGIFESMLQRLDGEGQTSLSVREVKLMSAVKAIEEQQPSLLGRSLGTGESRNQAIFFNSKLVPESTYNAADYYIGESENFILVLLFEGGPLVLVLFLFLLFLKDYPNNFTNISWFLVIFGYLMTESSFKTPQFLLVCLVSYWCFSSLNKNKVKS